MDFQRILISLKEIRVGSFQFNLKARDPLVLPAYKGSTFRGGFGHAFKRVVCALRNQDCPACLLKEKCLYSYVFETPSPSDTHIMRKYEAAPHPFVLEPPPEIQRVYQAVKMNSKRFPEDFMFELSREELNSWRSQFVTSRADKKGLRWSIGRKNCISC